MVMARILHRLELSLSHYYWVINQLYVYLPVSALREHPLGCDLHEPLSNSSICSENQNSKFLGFYFGQLVQRTVNYMERGGEYL